MLGIALGCALVVGAFAALVTGDPSRHVDPKVALADCASGNMAACDDLLFASAQGSAEETFALTCGERRPAPAATLALFGRQLGTGGSCESWGGGRN